MDATTIDTMIPRALQLASDELARGDSQTCKNHMDAVVRMVRIKGGMSKVDSMHGFLREMVILITGASVGIGIETARAMAATGARIVVAVRSPEESQQGCSDFLEPGWAELIKCDTTSLSSVREAVEAFLAKSQTLNILICNAGVMAVPQSELSVEGYENQLATNYFGHLLLL
ncbi:hypothetical protein SUNI508_05633 [Seiridium unicorne]|uniref:Uncharacterized protein n=1 Tax=Seiridium unicorne TaxID=138068 RepID=A0ABR2V461_9PEZI